MLGSLSFVLRNGMCGCLTGMQEWMPCEHLQTHTQ
jgi:hypothetical protein